MTLKTFLLLVLICPASWATGQSKMTFHIDSLPVKSLQAIGGYQQKKIFINKTNKSRLFEKLFWINRDPKLEKSEITVINKKTGQYLSVGSQLHDGTDWNNVFIVAYVSPKQNKVADLQTTQLFKTETGIQLGLGYEEIKTIMQIPPSVDISKDSIQMLRYYYYDFHDYQYEYYGIPKYMIVFKFLHGKLIKFGFGNYFDFFDSELSLKEFGHEDEFKEFGKEKTENEK